MSSLAATQSDGFYFPPEWRPEFGGLSKYQGSKGANQYQTHGIIRFELPFDAWCLKCGRHMSKGLRFNAKKEKAPEKYFTTQIWAFTMKCPCPDCDQSFVIKTDPENDTYNMAEGMRKMEQDFEPELNDSIVIATTDAERNLLATDPIFRLQHEKEDKRRALSAKEHLESLIDLQDSQREKDYEMNSLLRQGNRHKRKRAIFLLEEGKARGLSIPLVEEHDDDAAVARSIQFTTRSKISIAERSKMAARQSQSIFSSSSLLVQENEKSRCDKRGTKRRHSESSLSSEARKRERISAAMAKQAVVNINTKCLRISDSSVSTNSVTSSKFRITQLAKDDANDEDDKVGKSLIQSPVVDPKNALDLCSMYSDDD